MIRPHAKIRDWFLVDMETARPTYGKPGMKLEGAHALMHRNLLPLIETPDAIAALTRSVEPDRWLHRNAALLDRGIVLRTTQHQAIDFISPLRGSLLGDEMRLGKTLSSLLCHDPARGPLVVLGPLSSRATWLMWMRRVFPQFADQISVLRGRKFDRAFVDDKPIIWANYDLVQNWQYPLPIGTLVLDEAHMLVNHKTRRTLGSSFLAMRAQKVIAMTGTPIWDLPADLWAVLNIINPGGWGDRYGFCRRYGDPQTTAHGTTYAGLSHGAELRLRMSEIMLRRLWKDHADEAPAISRSVIVADIPEGDRNKLDIIAAALKADRKSTIGTLATYRKQVARYKSVTVRAEAEKITSRGEPVVVWTWHKDLAAEIAGKLDPWHSYLVHGEVNQRERDLRLDAWRADQQGVLVATMATLQAGIDLSHARIAIFAEIDYTPAILGQTEMRTFHPSRPMDVIFVVANHIVDQRIVRSLIHKLAAANPLGIGAAVEAIDALRDAVMGPVEEGDLDRLLEDLLASAA